MINNLQPYQYQNWHSIRHAARRSRPCATKWLSFSISLIGGNNREYETIIGSYRGVHIFLSSTGIGGASAGIAAWQLLDRTNFASRQAVKPADT